jgi:hypothetical protein
MGFYITGAPPCITVVLEFLPGCNILYIILVTPIDDEDGPMGGEVSQTIVEIQKPLTGDPTVLFDGAPACVEGVTMGPGNLINTIVDNEMNVQFTSCAV